MQAALALMRGIDAINDRIGRAIYWLILVTVLISSGNAVMRYGFNISSNAWLEIQWYLFSAIFLLGAGYAMLKNAHVRIDLVSSRFSHTTNAWVDVVGFVAFVIPMCLVFMSFGWDMFWTSWTSNERSLNAGGLILWPVKILVPIGFILLLAQSISELIKRIGYLRGQYDWSPHGSAPAIE